MTNNLTEHPPRSAREALGGIVCLPRFIDKVRALNEGTLGEYKCGIGSVNDEKLMDFLGFDFEDFKDEAATGADDQALLAWIQKNGKPLSNEEIARWSTDFTNLLAKDDQPRLAYISGLMKNLGLDEATTTTFDWLDADDKATFSK